MPAAGAAALAAGVDAEVSVREHRRIINFVNPG